MMAKNIRRPVEEYPGRATSCTKPRLNLMHHNVEYIILVLNKGPGPHPWCNQCDMFITRGDTAAENLGTAMCKRGAERKSHSISATSARVLAGTEL